MLNYIVNLYGTFIAKVIIILILFKINGKKFDIKDRNFYICLIIYFLVDVLFWDKNIRPLVGFVCIMFLAWKVLKKEPIQATLSAIYIYLVMIILEFGTSIMIVLFAEITTSLSLSKILKIINDNGYYSLIIVFLYSTLFYIFTSLKYVLNFYNKADQFLYKNRFKKRNTLLFPLFLFLIFSFEVVFLSNNLIIIILIYFLLFIFLLLVIASNFKMSNEYEKTKEKYNITLSNLVEYDKIIDKYRINNHENKNQLNIIRNMVKQKDKDIDKYIDNLLDTVYVKKDNLMIDVALIPAGPMRATIYSKLVAMEENHIEHFLNIDHTIKELDFFKKEDNMVLKICNLLNIFIDNAIDEVNLQQKKAINIDIYMDDENTIIFEVFNKFISTFDIERIGESKYTTKSKGHGYGLTFAKEIVDSEPRIVNETSITDDIFVQKLIVDIIKK